jgi:hypothetical protein
LFEELNIFLRLKNRLVEMKAAAATRDFDINMNVIFWCAELRTDSEFTVHRSTSWLDQRDCNTL